MLAAALALALLVLTTAVVLRRSPRSTTVRLPPDADAVDAVLPQTQCRQCGYAGCRPYAEAMVRREADINQCPPGGDAGVRALARLFRVRPKPLNPAHGPVKSEQTVAVIDEALCIGCTLCIQACPVDAILGASKQMHTVIADECTGCELCIAPCPIDCIRMIALPRPTTAGWRPWQRADAAPQHMRADLARRRHRFRLARLARGQTEHDARLRRLKGNAAPANAASPAAPSAAPPPDAIRDAIERARRRRAAQPAAVQADVTGADR